ncbi:NRDE family protein [uncultured Agitococcus sp.]|uniref:NRDE family protein n=1 Tax=uncultured Agitococcus sp. TaxID=1506599 RepID=UPI002608987E|nr:NRDE family protein [uncultured Agitococcus sp.]
MCLLAFAWQVHPNYPLILIGNRDEFYARPAQAIDYWQDAPFILAGRDEQEGGTWLGVTKDGRWAALTNYREPNAPKGSLSRGHLVAGFLKADSEPLAYAQQVFTQAEQYSGFNLLVGNKQQVAVVSNRGTEPQLLNQGIYGLSNQLLDSPWPKTQRLKAGLSQLMQHDHFDLQQALLLLQDQTQPDDADLPNTGVGLVWERLLATAFIKSPIYGTRASSILLLGKNNIQLTEQTWLSGEQGELKQLGFSINTFIL